MSMKILLLDNYDSFTYNLAESLRKLGKNNFKIETPGEIRISAVEEYDKVIFSPGPGLPDEHPVMFEILEKYRTRKPILGVCLGMQAIAVFFGARLFNLPEIIHGRKSRLKILDRNFYLFRDIPELTGIGLYHSWAVDPLEFPEDLEITAYSDDDLIMSIRHKTLDICGVQFHPESIITNQGLQMLGNWIKL